MILGEHAQAESHARTGQNKAAGVRTAISLAPYNPRAEEGKALQILIKNHIANVCAPVPPSETTGPLAAAISASMTRFTGPKQIGQ